MRKSLRFLAVCLCFIACFAFVACSQKDDDKVTAQELYEQVKQYAVKDEIIMNNQCNIYVNGNSFPLDVEPDYCISWCDKDNIYFTECVDNKYLLQSVDYNGKNKKLIQEVEHFLKPTYNNEVYSVIGKNYYFYEVGTLKLNESFVEPENWRDMQKRMYGYNMTNIGKDEGYTFEKDGKTIKIDTNDIHNIENIKDIIADYELKVHTPTCYGDTIYLGASIDFESEILFFAFKYENDKLTFVDACVTSPNLVDIVFIQK